jgi:glycosyltransferase involved in cell wall biosynthesis
LAASKRIPILFLFPAFDHLRPITGGQKYNSVMIERALSDVRFAVRIAPGAPTLPGFVEHNALLRRAWYQIRCAAIVLATPCSFLVTDVSSHSLVMLAIALARLLRRRTRIVIMAFHLRYITSSRVGLSLRIERLSEHELLRLADHCVAISEDSRARLLNVGVPAERVTIVRPAIDFPLPDLQALIERCTCHGSEHEIRLLYVGGCTPRKGLEYLIAAIGRLSDLRLHLDIVGRCDPQSPYVQKLQGLMRELGLEERITFTGRVSDEERAALYREADAFVFPSLDEGYGIVLVEAMGYGLPIVASLVGAIPELVMDHQTGLLVPPADPEALASAIARLASSPQEREELGRNGYRRARELARSWDTVGAELMALFARLEQR